MTRRADYPRPAALVFAVALSLAISATAQAQSIPLPNLQAVFPMGGKAGSEVEVTVSGKEIDGKQSLFFSHEGITSAPVILKADRFYPTDRAAANRFIVRIGRDVPTGSYEVRLVNPQGVSNARSFLVDRLPESRQPRSASADPRVVSIGSNTDFASATAVSINSIVNGVCTAQLSDYYKFTATRGQRLILHCTAQGADSRTDAVLSFFDPAGNHLQDVHDSVRLDPTLDFTVPRDGEFVVSVHDFLYRGGPEFGYRLAITTGPWIEFIDPPFAAPGSDSTHTLYGRNLPNSTPAPGVLGADGRQLEKLSVTIHAPANDLKSQISNPAAALDTLLRPTDGSIATFSYRLQTPAGISNPVRLALADGSLLSEEEPNDTPEKAQALTIPAQVIGTFNPRNDRDWYTFRAKKGEKLWIEVVSHRLGLPTDPCLLVQREVTDGSGKASAVDVAEADDQELRPSGDGDSRFRLSGDDPELLFTAPQDGSYKLLVRDLYASAQGEPRFFYLLSVRPAHPDFRLLAYSGRPDPNNGNGSPFTAVVHKGGTVQVNVLAFRRNGFDSEIQLNVEGLPPGVTTSPAVIGPSMSVASLVLCASPEAADWSGTIRITGRAIINTAEVVRFAQPVETLFVPQNGANSSPTRLVQQFPLAVRSDIGCPYSIQIPQAHTWRVPRGGKLQIPLKIARADGSKGAIQPPVQLTAQGLPQLARMPGGPITLNGQETTLNLDIDPTLSPGTFSFVMRSVALVPYMRNSEHARQATDDRIRIDSILQQSTTDSQKASEARQRAEQAAQQFQSQAAQLQQRQGDLQRLFDDAAKRQMKADQKLADAKAAADKAQQALDTAQQGSDAKTLKDARKALAQANKTLDQATKSAADARTAALSAADALSQSIQSLADARKNATQTQTDRQQAIDREAKAAEDLRLATEARQVAADLERVATDAARPRDYRMVVSSPPIVIEVVPAPFTLALGSGKIELKAGGPTADLFAKVKRDFAFTDEIRFDVQSDGGSIRLLEKHNRIASDQNEAPLTFQADSNVPPGAVTCTLRARYQLNGREVVLEQPVDVSVTKSDKK